MASWALILIVFGVIILVLALLATIWVTTVYRGLRKLKNNIDLNFSNLQENLKKKCDFISEFANFLKGKTKADDILKEVSKANHTCLDSLGADEEFALNEVLKNLDEVLVNSPLEKDDEFVALKDKRNQLEKEVLDSINSHNVLVEQYNNRVQNFPSCFIAQKFNFQKCEPFKAKENEKHA